MRSSKRVRGAGGHLPPPRWGVDRRPRRPPQGAGGVCASRTCDRGRSYLLWCGPRRSVPPRRDLRRSHFARRQASRATGSGPDQVRARDQLKNEQSARPDHSTVAPRPRRRGDRMRRREFISVIGSAAAAWSAVARAQQPSVPVIGYLGSGSRDSEAFRLIPFQQGLKEAGYVENRDVAFEYRWAENQNDRFPALAADLAGVAVIVALGSIFAVRAAKAATTTIPIVFEVGVDPVEVGVVASLNRPGGNVTGVTSLNVEIGPKELE